MKKLLGSLSVACLMSLLLIACNSNNVNNGNKNTNTEQIQKEVSSADSFEAAVVEKSDTTITVASNNNPENIYLLGTKGIDNRAEVGDKVIVWTTGQYEESSPVQGKATKIEVIE